MRPFVAVTAAVTAIWCSLWAPSASAQSSYTLFESGPVRPLALSPDGSRLFVCNIPDSRLEIFAVQTTGLELVGSVQVGLEPVAVAARTNGEVWVVNHLSDSISIVDVASLRVTRTLLVGDEPRDIVFAGPGKGLAFITAAHRGQNRPGDPQLQSGGVGRSDVWVFDSANLGAALGGTPLELLSLFGDTPRALAANANGSTVYAAVFHSGNQTTALPPTAQVNQLGPFQTLTSPLLPDGNAPDPPTLPTPIVALMLQEQLGATWIDANGNSHTGQVPFSLPDHDVFALDATASPPALVRTYDHVGTILFNMTVASNGIIYVSNTDANNMGRFEGFGTPNLRGELHRARISILAPGGTSVSPRYLNNQIDYSLAVAPASVNAASLGIPTDLAVTADASTLYVAAFGSGEIGIVDTAALALPPTDPNAFKANAADHIPLSAGGPGGLALDEAHDRLYVYTRFDDGVSIVDPQARVEVGHVLVHSPEPASITAGRQFLYDTHNSSSNGEAACGVCHVFGDFDSLAWDLGMPAPGGAVLLNNNPFVKQPNSNNAIFDSTGIDNIDFHPLKGPMVTQTLRGMVHDGPMHWRGDRSGGGFSDRTPQWDGDPNALDSNQAFLKFNSAFMTLLGRASQLADADMQSFATFILQLRMPPNPIRNLDQSLTASQANGIAFFGGNPSDAPGQTCIGCHTLDPSISAFGTSGLTAFSGDTQHFKVPQLRNLYAKVGMFGRNALGSMAGEGSPTTDQIRGFGFHNDGVADTISTFLNSAFFFFPGGDSQRADVANFLFAFPSDFAPVVGQQVTLTPANASDPNVTGRIDLLVARASTPYFTVDSPQGMECDLIVKGELGGMPRGWWMAAPGLFVSDRATDPMIADADLRQLATTPGQELTYTCAPPGSGDRLGIDRGSIGEAGQSDGILDADQCGDVSGDGIVTQADVDALRAQLAFVSMPLAPGKCDVIDADPNTPTCDLVDVVAIRRALAGLGPGLSMGCDSSP